MKKARLLDPQRINLYAYVRNNPLKYVDPDGADLLLAQGISKKDRDFIVKNLARYYMTEAGKKVVDNLDKVPFRIALGKGDLERKELNPAKMGEYKIGGQEKVTGGLTTIPYSVADGQKFLAAEAVGEKKAYPPITVTIDPSNSSDIGKDPARVMAHELGGHTSEAVNLAMRPTPGDPTGQYGPGRNITEFNGKDETASEAAEKAAGKLPDKPTPEAIKAVEEILKRREQ
jgi:hypothetical protein